MLVPYNYYPATGQVIDDDPIQAQAAQLSPNAALQIRAAIAELDQEIDELEALLGVPDAMEEETTVTMEPAPETGLFYHDPYGYGGNG